MMIGMLMHDGAISNYRKVEQFMVSHLNYKTKFQNS